MNIDEEKKAKMKKAILYGSIGGALVIGTIIFIIFKKRKAQDMDKKTQSKLVMLAYLGVAVAYGVLFYVKYKGRET